MEAIFGVYVDGSIVEVDLASGTLMRQVSSLKGSYHVSSSSVTTWRGPSGDQCSTTTSNSNLSSSLALIIQNKNSTKAHFWSCFDGATAFELRTPAIKFGHSNASSAPPNSNSTTNSKNDTQSSAGSRVTSLATSTCGRYLLRGMWNGFILVTDLAPPSGLSNSSSKAQSSTESISSINSIYWTHSLVRSSHLGAITAISTNAYGLVALASEDQTVSVCHLSSLLIPSYQHQDEDSPLSNPISNSLPLTSDRSVSNYFPETIVIHEHTMGITQVHITIDGRVFSISKDRSLKVSETSSSLSSDSVANSFVTNRLASITFPSSLLCMAVSPNDDFLYLGSQEGNIYKVNLSLLTSSTLHQKNGQATGSIDFDWTNLVNLDDHISSITAEPSVGTDIGDLQHHSASLYSQSIFRSHSMPICSTSLSMDGSKLVSSSSDGVIIIWDTATCQVIHRVSPYNVPFAWSTTTLKPFDVNTKKGHKSILASLSQAASGNANFLSTANNSSSNQGSIPLLYAPSPSIIQQSTNNNALFTVNSFASPEKRISLAAFRAYPLASSGVGTSSVQTHSAYFDVISTQEGDLSFQIDTFGQSLAAQLLQSQTSEVDNLKQEIETLKYQNEKWKEVNNSLFASSLSSAINQ